MKPAGSEDPAGDEARYLLEPDEPGADEPELGLLESPLRESDRLVDDVAGAVVEPPSALQLFAFHAASFGVRPLHASDMAVAPLGAAALLFAAGVLVEAGMAGFGWAGLLGLVVSSEALGAAA